MIAAAHERERGPTLPHSPAEAGASRARAREAGSPGRRFDSIRGEKGGDDGQSEQGACDERADFRLLEEVKAQLADSREQQERIARDLTQLLEQK